ncbi:MAG TPA: hypothetical protein VLS25_01260 [Dehalococcoidia bacterium]|nr:hypothetical protein [Dehalococcoidia bacterium]
MRTRSRTEEASLEEHMLLQEPDEEPQPPAPALILLAMDARGPACRRIHCFQDAEPARRFVKFWYPYRSGDAVVGYWLLTGEPLPGNRSEWRAEVLIIVRDSHPGVVYAFTRPDMREAREFLANEVQFGLNLADVLLFWVIPVQIENDFRGETIIFPHALPEGVTAGNPSLAALDERDMSTALALHRAST